MHLKRISFSEVHPKLCNKISDEGEPQSSTLLSVGLNILLYGCRFVLEFRFLKCQELNRILETTLISRWRPIREIKYLLCPSRLRLLFYACLHPTLSSSSFLLLLPPAAQWNLSIHTTFFDISLDGIWFTHSWFCNIGYRDIIAILKGFSSSVEKKGR